MLLFLLTSVKNSHFLCIVVYVCLVLISIFSRLNCVLVFSGATLTLTLVVIAVCFLVFVFTTVISSHTAGAGSAFWFCS